MNRPFIGNSPQERVQEATEAGYAAEDEFLAGYRFLEAPTPREPLPPIQTARIPYRALSFRKMCRHMIGLVYSDPRGWHAEWLMMIRDHGMCPGCAYNGHAHEQGCPIALMCHVASGLGHAAGEWPEDWRAS